MASPFFRAAGQVWGAAGGEPLWASGPEVGGPERPGCLSTGPAGMRAPSPLGALARQD